MRALTLVTQDEVDRAEEELNLVLGRAFGTERSETVAAVVLGPPLAAEVPHRVCSRPARQALSIAATVAPAVVAAVGAAILSVSAPLAWLVVPLAVAAVCAAWPGGFLRPAIGPLAGFVAAVTGLGCTGAVELWPTAWQAAVSGAVIAMFVALVLLALVRLPSAPSGPEIGA